MARKETARKGMGPGAGNAETPKRTSPYGKRRGDLKPEAHATEVPSKPIGATAVRLAMVKGGYQPIPLNGKRPLFDGWQNTVADDAMVRSWETSRPGDRNTGSLTRSVTAIDIDILDLKGVEIIDSLVRRRFAGKGKLLRRVGLAPKCAFLFRTDEPFKKLLLPIWAPGEPEPKELKDCKQRIEILGDGQQIVVHGIHPDTKQPYEWSGGEPWTVARAELPLLTIEEAKAFLNEARGLLLEADWGVFETKDKEREKKTAASEGEYPLIVELAVRLWGEPTYHVKDDYRFGSHGSKSIDYGTKTWFDFENNSGGGVRDLMKLVSSANGAAASTAEPKPAFGAAPFEWIDPSQIPKRQWLYAPHYIREFLSLLFSSGGKGKSSLLIVEALAMVSDKPLLNIQPAKRLRVWYWNGEDPILELQRRFAAAIKHYELTPEDIGDRLFINSGRTLPIVIAEDEKYGTTICEPVIADVIKTLIDNKIDVLIIDPFVSCHRVAENDNSAIERVAKSWSHIAEATHCSIMAAHHTRKMGGDRATVDDGRGASALHDAARGARTINTMTDAESENADIASRERRYYFRADIGKANLTQPAEEADWFKLVSVDLGNGDNEEGWDVARDGDKIGVVTPWDYPVDDTPRPTPLDIIRAQAAIRDGGPWRADQRATVEPWVGIPIANALGRNLISKTEKRAVADLVRDWLGAGFLKRVAGLDDHHEARSYIEAGNAPVVVATTGKKRDEE